MEKHKTNNRNGIEPNGNRFLKQDSQKQNMAQEHKDYLGMDVPDDYFNKSKDNILKTLPMKQETRTVFGLRPNFAYPMAAAILILLGVFVWLKQDSTTQIETQIVNMSEVDFSNFQTDDLLITSLMVEENEVDELLDAYILNEFVVKPDFKEQQMENLFINSLFVDDSLIDGYIDEGIFEHIIL